MKLSDYVVQFVARQGVRHVFMLPGGAAMHLNDSLGRCRDITYICNLHEQACAIAAEAYAKVTNGLGVAMVTGGPGGTNTITGVAGAWLDSTPCLFLSGQVKRADLKGDSGLRMLGVQEVDIVSLVSPITKYAVIVTDPCSIRFHMEKAVHLATTGRRGPVWIDIPLDVQATEIAPDELQSFVAPLRLADHEPPDLSLQVSRVLELVAKAERPVILVGHGVRAAAAAAEFLDVVEVLNVPVLTTWLGIDVIPDAHRLFVGRPGSIAPRGANFALQNADLLLILGARMDMALTAYAHDRLARAARKVMVDIDSAEISKMRTTIDVPIQADAGEFLREIRRQAKPQAPRSAWLARCATWKRRYPVVTAQHRRASGPISAYHFSEVLSEQLSATDIVAPGSSGFASEIFLLAFKAKAGQRVFHNRGTGAMGFGLPGSIGACLGGGRRRTICVDGDGGFQMNIQELATIAALNLPIKFFVLNNQGYASIRASQQAYFGRLVAADSSSGLRLPDLGQVTRAYGLAAFKIEDSSQLQDGIRASLASRGPAVCEIVVIPDEARAPRVASRQRADGSMVSSPLEDLWPFLEREEFLENMIIAPLAE